MPTNNSSPTAKIFHVPWIKFHRPSALDRDQSASDVTSHHSVLLIFPDDPDASSILITEDPSPENSQCPDATITFPAYKPTEEDTVSESMKVIEAIGLGGNGIPKPAGDSLDVDWNREMKVCFGTDEAMGSWVRATDHSNGKAGVPFHIGETTLRGPYLSLSFQPAEDDAGQVLIEAWRVNSAPLTKEEKMVETRY